MAYSQSKKLTAREKKLLTLRSQLYGKEKPDIPSEEAAQPASFKFSSPKNRSLPLASHLTSETTYLKKDLQKIGILATLVLVVQALLYIALQRGFTIGSL